jgi:hypothetical protein
MLGALIKTMIAATSDKNEITSMATETNCCLFLD